jgi:glycosyltransferase involved in cell wall biosynthesis
VRSLTRGGRPPVLPLRAMPPSISVVFPMRDEEEYVRRAVTAALGGVGEAAGELEIVVVDDGSTDRTREIADALAREDSRVRVVSPRRSRGLGAALRAGYASARGELVLYSDADLPFDFGEVGRAVRLLGYQEADVLAAYRFDRTSEGLVRTVYTLAYSALVRVLFGLRLRDVNFSFKLFRRSLLERIELRSDGSFIDAEFLVRARNAGARVIQMGVDYFPRSRGRSTLASPAVILGILGEMTRLAPGLWRGRLPGPRGRAE